MNQERLNTEWSETEEWKPESILVVEDDEGLSFLISRRLKKEGLNPLPAQTGSEAISIIEENENILMLLDILLPDMNGRDLIDKLESKGKLPPFIIMTGYRDEDIIVEMLKKGALDYVFKSAKSFDLIPQKIEQASAAVNKNKQLEKANLQIRLSEAKLKEAERIAHLGYWELDLRNYELAWSDELYRIFEVDPEKFKSTYEAYLECIHPDDRDMVNEAFINSVKNKVPYEVEHRLLLKNGRIKYVNERCNTYYNDEGEAIRSLGTAQDITERKVLEIERNRSSRILQGTFDSLINAVFIVDADSRVITDCNKSAEKIFGYNKSEMIGRNTEFLHVNKEMYREFGAEMIRGLDAEGVYETEFQVKRKDGSIISTTHTVTEIRDEQGMRTGLVSVVRDETKIKEEVEKFKLITENSADAIFITDNRGNYKYVNNAVCSLLGYTAEQLKNMNISDLVTEDQIHSAQLRLKEILQKGKMFTEVELVKKDGSLLPVDLNAVLLPNGMVYGSCRDISERKETEEKVIKKNKELERFKKLSVGREMRMIELKQKVNELSEKLNFEPPYPLSFLREDKTFEGS